MNAPEFYEKSITSELNGYSWKVYMILMFNSEHIHVTCIYELKIIENHSEIIIIRCFATYFLYIKSLIHLDNLTKTNVSILYSFKKGICTYKHACIRRSINCPLHVIFMLLC